MIFKNATIITMNEKLEILHGFDMCVRGDSICEIAENIDDSTEDIIDCTGKILIPGLINTHCHIPMSLFRTLGEEEEDRLFKYTFPIEGKFITPQNVKIATYFSLLETIKSGMTTICDMYYYDKEIADCLKNAGVRGVMGETIINQGGDFFNKQLGQFKHMDNLYEHYCDDELITVAVAPHAPYTNSGENLIKADMYAKEKGLKKIIHVAEMENEKGEFRGYDSVIKYLDSIKILDENTILVHMLHVDEEDLDIVSKRGCTVSHNPVSNAKGGRKIMPLKLMKQRDIKVGLGTDGQMSGNLLDLQSVMYVANKIHKHHEKSRNFLSSKEIFKMVTIDAAKVIGIDNKVGSLEVGKKADVVVINPKTVNMYPVYEYYSALVNGFRPNNVEVNMVNGKVLYQNGEYKTLDYNSIFEKFVEVESDIREYLKL